MKYDRIDRVQSHSLARSFVYFILLCSVIGCGGDIAEPRNRDISATVARITMRHPAVMMSTHAPYDTIRLSVIALNLRGDTLELHENVKFFKSNSLDTTCVVTSVGDVTARVPTPKTDVIAEVRLGDGRTLQTTASIMIRDEWPVRKLHSISAQPINGDSAIRWNQPRNHPINSHAYFLDGSTSVPRNEWLGNWTSRNTSIASFSNPLTSSGRFLITRAIGDSWFVLQTHAYGETFVDSVRINIIPIPYRAISITRLVAADGSLRRVAQPANLTIPLGTTIGWMNFEQVDKAHESRVDTAFGGATYKKAYYGDSLDIVFDGPAPVVPGQYFLTCLRLREEWSAIWGNLADRPLCHDPTGLGGNIPAWSAVFVDGTWDFGPYRALTVADAGVRTRKFTVPGTYTYRSTKYPTVHGTILVRQ